MGLERKFPENQAEIDRLREGCRLAFANIGNINEVNKAQLEQRIEKISSPELLQAYVNFINQLIAYQKVMKEHAAIGGGRRLYVEDRQLFLDENLEIDKHHLFENYLTSRDVTILNKYADLLEARVKINQINKLISTQTEFSKGEDWKKYNELIASINITTNILRRDIVINPGFANRLLQKHLDAIKKLIEYKQALDNHLDQRNEFCQDKKKIIQIQETTLLLYLRESLYENRIRHLEGFIDSLDNCIRIVKNSDALIREVQKKAKDPAFIKNMSITKKGDSIYKRSKQSTYALLNSPYSQDDENQNEKKRLAEILLNTKKIVEFQNTTEMFKYAEALNENLQGFTSQYVFKFFTAQEHHGIRMVNKASKLVKEIRSLPPVKATRLEVKNVQSDRAIVTVLEMPLVPHVVDIGDLGDPEKGYLIGEEGRKILLDPRMNIGLGRYSKIEVRRRMKDNLGLSDEYINKVFPYLPGILREPAANINFDKNLEKCHENEMHIYLEKGEIKYIAKDIKGKEYSGTIVKGSGEGELAEKYFHVLLRFFNTLQALDPALKKIFDEKEKNIKSEERVGDEEIQPAVLALISKQGFFVKDDIYAIYKGEKQGKLFGKGNYGKAKAAFNVSNNEWTVDKVQIPRYAKNTLSGYDRERDFLKEFNLSTSDFLVRRYNSNDYKFCIMKKDTVMEQNCIYFGIEETTIIDKDKNEKIIRNFICSLITPQNEVISNYSIPMEPPDPFTIRELELQRGKILDVLVGRGYIIRPKIDQIMSYIEGESLLSFFDKHKEVPPIILLDIAIKFLSELDKIHKKGYLHLDLAFRNILYNPLTGKVTIIDFGFTKEQENKEQPLALENKADKKKTPTEEEVFQAVDVIKGLLEVSAQFFSNYYALRNIIVTSRKANNLDVLNDVEKELKKTHDELVPISFKTIGILNISDFEKMVFFNKFILLEFLKLVDVVVLVDNDNTRDMTTCLNIRKELMEKNIFVGSKIIFSQDPNALIEKIKEEYNNKDVISHFCHFHPKGTTALVAEGLQSIEADPQFSPQQVKEIIKNAAPVVVSKEHLIQVASAILATINKYCSDNAINIDWDIDRKKFGIIPNNKQLLSPQVIACVSKLANTILEMKQQTDNRITYTYPQLFSKLRSLEDAMAENKSYFSKSKDANALKEARRRLDENREARFNPRPH